MMKIAVGMLISLLALWWAFRGLDWPAFKAALAGADLGLVLLSLAMLAISIPIRAYRWGIFLLPVRPTRLRITSEATLVGYFGNNALPFRLGELLRAYFLHKRIGAPFSQILGTVIIERLIDAASFILVLAFLPLVGHLPPQFQTALQWALVGVLLVSLLLVFLARWGRVPFLRGRLRSWVDNIKVGFKSLRHARHYPALLATSLAIWGLYLLSAYFGLQALHLGLTLSQSYLVLVAGSLAISIPAAPGFVGTYHAGVILILISVFHLELAAAQAAAVLLHAIGFIPVTLVGGIIYLRSHLRLRDVKELTWEP
ncbi:MAG: flippase-like domain-containing protein [Candidatus Marinimicrobia bacterium]|nr:flippase-like domain-containing protein [Candidatus Neomarinimicrobiota bacterium]